MTSYIHSLEAKTITYSYDENSNLIAVDGPRIDITDITAFDYHPNGYIALVKNPLGHSTSYSEYTAFGNPGKIIDPNGLETNITYDNMGRPTSIIVSGSTPAEARITHYQHDALGQLTSITLPGGQTTQYEYDDLNNVTAIETESGNRIEYLIDSNGNPMQEKYTQQGQTKKVINYVYNQLQQLESIISGEGIEQNFMYDGNAQTVSTTDGAGNPSWNQYDALGRPVSNVDADLSATNRLYTDLGFLSQVVDGRNVTTTYQYNIHGEIISQSSPDTGHTTYEVDHAGNRTAKIDARGVRVEYSYDALNRLTDIHYPSSPNLDVQYIYDENPNGIGQLSRVIDATGEMSYYYDDFGNISERVYDIDDLTLIHSYTYDANDQVTTEIRPSGRVFSYQRDSEGNIVSVSTSIDSEMTSLVDNVNYLPFGPPNSWIMGNGLLVEKSFDLDYRVSDIKSLGVQNLAYSYTNNSNISTIDDHINDDFSQSFNYDNLNRLTAADGEYGEIQYDYDEVSNRLGLFSQSESEIYIYDENSNRLQSVAGQDFTEFTYDATGNIISDNEFQYVYNDQNRLVEVLQGGEPIVQYQYNASGQRVKKILPDESATHYLYSLNGQLLVELNESGEVVREYFYMNGEPLALFARGADDYGVVSDNDSPNFSASEGWESSVNISGFEGSDYLYHYPHDGLNNPLILDNISEYFTVIGNWAPSSAIPGYEGNNYLHYFGSDISDGLILDDTDGITEGGWVQSANVSGYEGNGYQHCHSQEEGSAFNWPIASPQGDYRIYAKWTSHANRSSEATYSIIHSEGLVDITVDQSQSGGEWRLLGTYALDSDSQVSLSCQGDGYNIADAIQLVPVNAASSMAVWTPGETGIRNVYAKWTSHPNRATNATYRVEHAEGSDTITVNQQESSGQWYLLGSFALNEESQISLLGEGDGYIIADAIAIENPNEQPHQAAWSELVTEVAEVKLYAKWTPHPNRATDATYKIHHTEGITTVSSSQRKIEGEWYLLGTYLLDELSKVVLEPSTSGYVIADAIKVVFPSSGTSSTYYYHNNHLATPQVVTDDQQEIVWRGHYKPFGEISETVAVIDQPLRFPGQYHDEETGHYYNYFRDYDPSIGRYVQSDPIGLDGGINTFGYVNANPIIFFDPFGLCKCVYLSKSYDDGGYYGEPHVGGLWYTFKMTCNYMCEGEMVASIQTGWYINSRDTRNAVCNKAFSFVREYDHAGFSVGWTETSIGEFNAKGSGIKELESWAIGSCNECEIN